MNLVSKYSTAAPRYTSYPTVPYWNGNISIENWKDSVKKSFDESNQADGISVYIHLPYCESLCTYCACNTRITVNHAVEKPYIEAVLKEWNLYLSFLEDKPRIKEIHLGGGTPTFFTAQNLKILIEGILKGSETLSDSEFSFEGHPGNTTTEHLQTLYDLGFKRVSFGIQDFDDKVQEAINRYQTFEEVKNVVDEARRIGYSSINFDLVYGLPFQTRASVTDTIDKIALLRPDRIAYYSYAHVPWLKPGQRKFTEKDLPVDIEKRALYEIGKEKFLSNGYEEIGMDHFALPNDSLTKALHNKTLHRNFMGYSHNYTQLMIGLGVSSISDSWYAFAQNLKKVEDYFDVVNKGEFPVFKGHELSDEDLIIRKHILNLMCRYETSWRNENQKWNTLNASIERLNEMQNDGLVVIKNELLKVTDKGKQFLRNICLCFDAHYWKKIPGANVFSNSV